MEYKVYVVGTATGYANWIGDVVSTIEEADIVLFTGGEDVDPSLYNAPKNRKTSSNLNRDHRESMIFDAAQLLKKPCIGICRGSQFLCVMSGGELVQHQENPMFVHNIEFYNGDVQPITSTHHQAQYPYALSRDKYRILAWTKGLSRIHEDGEGKELPIPANKECEIVYYKDTNCLAIQGHPEMMVNKPEFEEAMKFYKRLVGLFMAGVFFHSCGNSVKLTA